VDSTKPSVSEPVPTTFKVTVPPPHPGIQFRKSKNLSDKYSKFAENGAVYTGLLESDGEWLQIKEDVYLPAKIGLLQVLTPVVADEQQAPSDKDGHNLHSVQHWSDDEDVIEASKKAPQCGGQCTFQ